MRCLTGEDRVHTPQISTRQQGIIPRISSQHVWKAGFSNTHLKQSFFLRRILRLHAYTEDLLRPYRPVDLLMPSSKKVKHITKEIRYDACKLIISKSSTSVSDIVEILGNLQDDTNACSVLPLTSAKCDLSGYFSGVFTIEAHQKITHNVVPEGLTQLGL